MNNLLFVSILAWIAMTCFTLVSPSSKRFFTALVKKFSARNGRYRVRFFRTVTRGNEIKPSYYGTMFWFTWLIVFPFFLYALQPGIPYAMRLIVTIVMVLNTILIPVILFMRAEYILIKAMQKRFRSKMRLLRENIEQKEYLHLEFALGSVMSFHEYDDLMNQIDVCVSKLPSHLRN